MGEGAGVGGEAGAEGKMLNGIPVLLEVERRLGRCCETLWRVLDERRGSIGIARGAEKA